MKAFSWKRFRVSLQHALIGVRRFFRLEANAKIHLLATLVVLLFAIILRVKPMEWAILILCIVVVISAEMFNSAIEKLSDQVTKEYAPLIKDAKDIAAGAVLVLSIGAAIIGLMIFLPYLLHLFR